MTDPKQHEIDRDDELLTALGRGERPTPDDRLAVMLAAWRADLTGPDATERSVQPLRSAAPRPEPDVSATRPVLASILPASTLPASTLPASTLPASTLPASTLPASTLPASTLPASTLPASTLPASTRPTPSRPGARRAGLGQGRSRRNRLAAAVAAVALLAGGLAAAASVAAPDSPLWPVTQLIYPQRADRVAAQDALDQARTAIRDGRVKDANRLLDQAQALIANVDDPAERSQLRGDLDQLRKLLSSAGSVIGPGNASPSQAPQSGGPGSAATAGPAGPTPGPLPPTPLLPLPGLPTSILPTQILPTSLLPSLPIIG